LLLKNWLQVLSNGVFLNALLANDKGIYLKDYFLNPALLFHLILIIVLKQGCRLFFVNGS
jgi:hypothetical protein